MILSLVGCVFPDFEATDVPTETDVEVIAFPVVSVVNGQALATGPFAAPLGAFGSGGFATGGLDGPGIGEYEAEQLAADGTLEDTWVFDGTPGAFFVSPLGVWDTDAPRFVTAMGGAGIEVRNTNGTYEPPVLPPLVNNEVFASAAAVAGSELIVAGRGTDTQGRLYRFTGAGLQGSLAWFEQGAGDTGRFLALADLDDDPQLEILAGTGGDYPGQPCVLAATDCDTAALWGLELPDGTDQGIDVADQLRTRFRFRIDGSSDFDPPIGAAGAVVDLDGDGCDELIVGGPFHQGGDGGAVHVVPCIRDVAAANRDLDSRGYERFVGSSGSFLGASVIVLDGFLVEGEPAVAVSAFGAPGGGRVYVFRPRELMAANNVDLGDADDRWLVIEAAAGMTEVGIGLSNLGDLDQDGRDDLGIGGRAAGVEQLHVWRTGTVSALWSD